MPDQFQGCAIRDQLCQACAGAVFVNDNGLDFLNDIRRAALILGIIFFGLLVKQTQLSGQIIYSQQAVGCVSIK